MIERPASVVKELIENSIDAGANFIQVEIKGSPDSYLRISDNGHGMDREDAILAFQRHATSKISTIQDVENIASLGFRGEALASVAAIAKVRLITREPSEISGAEVRIEGGVIKEVRETACAPGTIFEIKNLFFNVPARKKFLKKETTEISFIQDVITQFTLAYPDISFAVSRNNKTVLHSSGNGIEEDTLLTVYGEAIAAEMLKIVENPNRANPSRVKVTGFISKPSIARSSGRFITLTVNRRFIRSRLINKAIATACSGLLKPDRFPIVVIHLELDPMLVDVNVHPQKMEVRFRDEREIFGLILDSLEYTLLSANLIENLPMRRLGDPFSREEPVPDSKEIPATQPAPMTATHQSLAGSAASVPFKRGEEAPSYRDGGPHSLTAGGTSAPFGGRVTPFSPNKTHPNEKPRELSLLEEERDPDPRLIRGLTLLGQFDRCFLIGINGPNILLIDQHVAHERVLFEKINAQYETINIKSQALLFPIELKILPDESALLESHRPAFENLGFQFRSEKDGAVFLTGIPALLLNSADQGFILEALNSLLVDFEKKSFPQLKREVIATMACKMAIKANKELRIEEMQALIEQLSQAKNPFFCPHGRPILLKITRDQLNTIFLRH